MQKLQKLKDRSIREKYLAILSVLILAAGLLPMLRLACYAVPWYDDYNFMNCARSYSIQYEKGYLYGAWRAMKQEWYAWQGTYSTTFLTALNPFQYGERYQKFGIMGIILGFVLCMMSFCLVTLGNVLKAERSAKWLISSTVTASCVWMIYAPHAGIFWFNAAIHYTLMAGIMFLMLAGTVKIFYCKRNALAAVLSVLVSVLGFVCAGSNYVTILQGLLLLLTLLALGILFRRMRTWFLLLPTLCFSVGFLLNVTAPGNSVRSSNFQGDGIITAILNSFLAAGRHFWELTGPMMFLCMLLLIPTIWGVAQKTDFTFRLPGLVSLYSVCLYATGFVSSRYAMGSDGIDRTWVSIKFTLQILLYLNEIYWIGWIVRKGGKSVTCRHHLLFYLLIVVMASAIFFTTENKLEAYTPYGAYYFVHSGEAYNFYQEYLNRIETLQSNELDVVVTPYGYRPFYLLPADLDPSPTEAPNISMARWYHKNSISCQYPEE